MAKKVEIRVQTGDYVSETGVIILDQDCMDLIQTDPNDAVLWRQASAECIYKHDECKREEVRSHDLSELPGNDVAANDNRCHWVGVEYMSGTIGSFDDNNNPVTILTIDDPGRYQMQFYDTYGDGCNSMGDCNAKAVQLGDPPADPETDDIFVALRAKWSEDALCDSPDVKVRICGEGQSWDTETGRCELA